MSSKYKNMPIFNIFYFFDIKIFENSQKRSIFKLFWCKNKVYYLDLVFPKKWEVPKRGGSKGIGKFQAKLIMFKMFPKTI